MDQDGYTVKMSVAGIETGICMDGRDEYISSQIHELVGIPQNWSHWTWMLLENWLTQSYRYFSPYSTLSNKETGILKIVST